MIVLVAGTILIRHQLAFSGQVAQMGPTALNYPILAQAIAGNYLSPLASGTAIHSIYEPKWSWHALGDFFERSDHYRICFSTQYRKELYQFNCEFDAVSGSNRWVSLVTSLCNITGPSGSLTRTQANRIGLVLHTDAVFDYFPRTK
jgi:hypothetical protein